MLALPDDRLLDANDKIRYFQVLTASCGLIAFFIVMSIIWLKTMKTSKMYPRFGQVMQQGQKIYQAFVDAGLMQMTSSEIEPWLSIYGLYWPTGPISLYVGSYHWLQSIRRKMGLAGTRQMVFLEGSYLRGESRETYEQLLIIDGTVWTVFELGVI